MPIRQVHSRPVAVGELAEITSDNANGLHPVWDLFDRCAGWPSGAAPLEPDVPVLAPLFEGEPSRMVSRDTPGDTDECRRTGTGHGGSRSTIVDLQSQFAWSRRVQPVLFDR